MSVCYPSCPHCGSIVAKKTYTAHRHLYFNSSTDTWIKKKKMEYSHSVQRYIKHNQLTVTKLGEAHLG